MPAAVRRDLAHLAEAGAPIRVRDGAKRSSLPAARDEGLLLVACLGRARSAIDSRCRQSATGGAEAATQPMAGNRGAPDQSLPGVLSLTSS